MKYNDWMPSAREGQLAMCGGWLAFLTPERRAAWGIPEGPFAELAALHGAAEALLPEAANRAERTHVIVVETRGAFRAMKAAMRSFRSRFFTLPPLDAAAWAALGFRAKRRRKGKVPPPPGAPAASLGYTGGGGVLVARLGPLAGTEEPDLSGSYGYAVYVGVRPQGGATLEQAASEKHYLMKPPKGGKELFYYRFTRRRKLHILFDAEDSGKTAYVCCRYENGKGEAGNWGPVVSAVIP